jgi:hypothetical protein
MSSQEDASASTITPSRLKRKRSPCRDQSESIQRILSQEELKAWWPFTRLDPKRFPKTAHEPEKFEEAPF